MPNINIKPLSSFSDLKNSRVFYDLHLKHFKEGLDPSLIIDKNSFEGAEDYLISYISSTEDKNAVQNHILFLLLQRLVNINLPQTEKEEIKSYFKEHFTRLYKEGKISQKIANQTAFMVIEETPDLLEHLIKNGVVSVDLKDDAGQTFLMQVQDKARIEMLIGLGASVNMKVDLPQSKDFGKTAYDLALANRKKGWIANLKPYIPENDLESKTHELLSSFLAEQNYKKQLLIFMRSLKESNPAIIEEISTDETKYKNLIEYRDGRNKNLLHHCVSNNSPDIALKVMNLNYYKNNKTLVPNPAFFLGDCYCSYALNMNRQGMAKLMFEHGYYVQSEMIKTLESVRETYPSIAVFNLLIDTGYCPSLKIRWKNQSIHRLEEYLKTLPMEKINEFIKTQTCMFDLGHVKLYNQGKNILYHKANTYTELVGHHVRFFCRILKYQKSVSPDMFDTHLKEYLLGLNKTETKIFEYFSLITLSVLPLEHNKILSLLQSDRPFVIKMQKENLEKVLEKFEAQEVKKFKI